MRVSEVNYTPRCEQGPNGVRAPRRAWDYVIQSHVTKIAWCPSPYLRELSATASFFLSSFNQCVLLDSAAHCQPHNRPWLSAGESTVWPSM